MEQFREGLVFIARKGNKTRFWQDLWIGEELLQVSFPNLYNVSRKKNHFVRQFYSIDVDGHVNWNLDLRRRLTEIEITEAMQLTNLLQSFTPSDDEDTRRWKWTPDGVFTVKSCYAGLQKNQNQRMNEFPFKVVWNENVPPKVCFFIWLVHHDSILTQDVLARRGRTLVNRCCLCKESLETINHLFIYCKEVVKIWDFFLPSFGMSWVQCGDIKKIFQGFNTNIFSYRGNFIWNLLPYVICWTIWKERNNRMFNLDAKEKDSRQIVLDIKASIFYWSHPSQCLKGVRFEDLVFKWEELVRS